MAVDSRRRRGNLLGKVGVDMENLHFKLIYKASTTGASSAAMSHDEVEEHPGRYMRYLRQCGQDQAASTGAWIDIVAISVACRFILHWYSALNWDEHLVCTVWIYVCGNVRVCVTLCIRAINGCVDERGEDREPPLPELEAGSRSSHATSANVPW